ncbi:MAG TPA: peptide chain release factor N(5)-glutamine methyltransferase [Dietzia timorensis]|uniref:peptide chain release factor N(5)-glutamine methyltransferase n=1 Tax=Dietzia timorensis TaxID=499555 RepID=A0A921JYX2_9ACTN|nr:peptide chain release factor N(5)-glutamine methyltransferase [Dietzia timorensis]HJE91624.1 peptide chain release factor N(5)-glutamine methyltransferase [Dietzia timorensis]
MTSDAPSILAELTSLLSEGGIESASAEAATILSQALGTSRASLAFADVPAERAKQARSWALRRADTLEPLQYILGTAVSGRLDMAVGPGVFIPRPETELLVDWALRSMPATHDGGDAGLVVIDLCSGSGTIALEVAHAMPRAQVYAVEADPKALDWLRRNAASRAEAGDTPVTVCDADATDASLLRELDGRASAVLSNPPYVPSGADLPAEVAEHEPGIALFAGPEGTDVIERLVPVAARLLADGGIFACEHDDSNGAAVTEILGRHGGFGRVNQHRDLAGRPRFVTAVRVRESTENTR